MIILFTAIIIMIVWSVFQSRRQNKNLKDWYAKVRRQIAETFKGKKVCVAIRTSDGKRTSLESVVIDSLADAGVEVKYISADNATRAWRQEDDIGIYGADFLLVGSVVEYKPNGFPHKRVDFRILGDNYTKILGAKVVEETVHGSDGDNNVAWSVLSLVPEIIGRHSS